MVVLTIMFRYVKGGGTENERALDGTETRFTSAYNAFSSFAGRAAASGCRRLPAIGEPSGKAGGRSANPFAAHQLVSMGTYLYENHYGSQNMKAESARGGLLFPFSFYAGP